MLAMDEMVTRSFTDAERTKDGGSEGDDSLSDHIR